VTATIALVVALGSGGAMAAGKITGKDIGKNAVASKHIKNGTIKVKDLSKAAQPGAGPQGPQGPPGAAMTFDYDKTFTGLDLGNPVPSGSCVGTDTGPLTPRAGTDGTIADDLVLVSLKSNTFIGTILTGRTEGTNQVRFSVCNFSGAPRNFNGLSIRVATVDNG
jgi:hypothetical protein